MNIEWKRDALYPSYALPSPGAVFQALHADAFMRTTPENVQDVLEAVRRILDAAPDQSPATSAADAKDAARYRWLRAADWDDITSLYWSPQVQHAGTPEDCMLKLDEAIDAAMAAAPSSAAGTGKPAEGDQQC